MRRQLADLVRPVETMASVYIGLDSHDLPVRWRRLETSLLAQGAPKVTVEIMDQFVRGMPLQPKELAVFAAGDRLLWYLDTGGTIRVDRAEFGAPPLVLPLLELLGRRPAHVRVVVDRTGAEITTVVRGASSGTTFTVCGPDDEIRRGGPRHGDHPKYERRAVSSWQHNAGAVAAAATTELKKVDAELLLVAGQPRIVKAMLEQLPAGLPVVVSHLPGGRSPDGSGPILQSAAASAIAEYASQHGPRPDELPLVRGVADTLRALAAGQVKCLFIVDDPSDMRVAWFGSSVLCAEELADALRQGRLSNVAVRAALLTDADVRVVEPGRLGEEGIGALCRFA